MGEGMPIPEDKPTPTVEEMLAEQLRTDQEVLKKLQENSGNKDTRNTREIVDEFRNKYNIKK